MRTELEPANWDWPAHTEPRRGLICCGADLVHLTEELHIRLLALTLVMLGVAGALTLPLAQTNAREHVSVATVIFVSLAIVAAVAGFARRQTAYRWLRATRVHQLTPAVVAAAIVLADGPYSPSWWTAEALLFVVAAVSDLRSTALASATTAAAYLASIWLRGDSLLPGGNNEYLTVALAVAVNPLVARAIAEIFAKFTLRLHQIERETAEVRRAPVRVQAAMAPASVASDSKPPPRRTSRRWRQASTPGNLSLTARQLEVALLARDGLRQAEIAAALAISPRQVERHLEQARQRADAATTAQLIAMLVASGLTPATGTP